MKVSNFVTSFNRGFYTVQRNVKSRSPEILLIVGIGGAITSTLLACKGTIKVIDILEEHNETLEVIHEVSVNPEAEYTEDDKKRDTAALYIRTGAAIVKAYTPAMVVGVASYAGIIKSNDILRKRCAGFASAYAITSKLFKEYRKRVIEKYGEEIDKELRYDIKAVEYEETTTNKKGEEKTVTKKAKVSNIDEVSDFARYFAEGNPIWNRSPEQNLTTLRVIQSECNAIIRARAAATGVGIMSLNEVYQRLGFEPTNAGMVVGWVYDFNNPIGDNYIDFGLCDSKRKSVRDFVNGIENTILLDFNVDGTIYGLVEENF